MSNDARSGRPVDVVVIGSGHNGLVAACYLARAGLDVLVVERSPAIGGCTSSVRGLIPEAPEFVFSPCAVDIITMRASTVVRDLELARFGYREVDIDPGYLTLNPDGSSLGFWRDIARTADEIRHFSPRDAAAYLDLMRTFDRVADLVVPVMTTNLARPQPRDLIKLLAGGAKRARALKDLITGFGHATAEQAIRERFSHPNVQSGLAQIANYASPITGEGTGPNVMFAGLIARYGVGRPIGGMGALPAALATCLAAAGGRIRTSTPVEQLAVHGDRVTGVRLDTGEVIQAGSVLAATDPYSALNRLVPPGALSDEHTARVAHIPTRNDGCAHFKIEVAARGRLQLKRHAANRRDGLDVRIPSHQAGTIDDVVTAIGDAQSQRLATVLPFTSAILTAADPSCAPAGSDTLSLWTGWVPHDPPGGWDVMKPLAEKHLHAHAAEFYDGIEELEVGRWVESPVEMTERTGVPNSNVYHVDLCPTRIGPLRPARGFGGYSTPIRNFYLGSAGTHPGPSVSGFPGQQAARHILRRLKTERRGRSTRHAAPADAPGELR